MTYYLFDDPAIRLSLLPFTFTRPVACIRVGVFTIAEKWEKYLETKPGFKTQDYLQTKFPKRTKAGDRELHINGAVCPTLELYEAISELHEGQALIRDETVIAYFGEDISEEIPFKSALDIIKNPWDIFQLNGNQIREDFKLVRSTEVSGSLTDPHTKVYNPENIFIAPGVKIRAAVLNAEAGPVYLGKNSEVQEGALIKGPFALGEGAVVNMGGKMRGDTTVGPFSKVGGEISNSVIFGYSNKAHDGFIGNTVIGEWCNLGADTNISNLKNNYSPVSIFDFKTRREKDTGLQFCGLMMGDHSKTSINCMVNTGTVTGVCTNIFGHGFPPKFVPSFAWGGSEGFEIYKVEKAFQTIEKVMARRGVEFTPEDQKILMYLYENESLRSASRHIGFRIGG